MSDRCTGHCCRRLTLPFSPAELVRHRDFELAYSAWEFEKNLEIERKGELSDKTAQREPKGGSRKADILQIADMLEYIGYFPPGNTFIAERGGDAGTMRHHYRCKNVLTNNDCAVYATRPSMCSSYPYGKRCEYAACTWEAVKRTDRAPPPEESYEKPT